VANIFDQFDTPVANQEKKQRNIFDQFDEPSGVSAEPAEMFRQTAPTTPAIPQLPVAPITSEVPEDEGFFERNYRYAKDALISGFQNLRANTKGTALAISQGAVLRDEEEYGGPGVPLAPPEVKARYERNRSEAQQYRLDVAQAQQEAQERQLASPLRPETARLKAAMNEDDFLTSAYEAGAALISNPVGVIADLGTESLPSTAYMVSTALLARVGLQSPTAAAAVGGGSSAISQFGNEYVDRLQKGEDHDEAWKNAAIRSGVIGTFDAVSLKTAGSAAGTIIDALKTGKPATVAAKEFTKELGKQAGLGGAGEAAGSLAIGEVPNPASVIAEAAGELVTGPIEAVSTYKRVKSLAAPEDKLIAELDAEAAKEEATILEEEADEEANLRAQVAAREDLEDRGVDVGIPLRTDVGQPITGGGEPSISVPGEPGELPSSTQELAETKPTGLGDVGAPAGVPGGRKEPTLGAVNPEDTYIFSEMFRFGGDNQPLQNYVKAYFGLPAKSLPAAASKLMPLLQRADGLLQSFNAAYNASNEPFLGTGAQGRYKREATRSPEYTKILDFVPSGDARRLANNALAIDKNYKTKGNNPERFDKEIATFESTLNAFESAISNLPPPLTNEERQAREAAFQEGEESYDIREVPEERRLEALMNLLRKEPERLNRAKVKQAVYTPAKTDPAKLQQLIDAGITNKQELDLLQRQSDNAFAAPQPEEKKQPSQLKTADDLEPPQRSAYETEKSNLQESLKQAGADARERGLPYANAVAPFVDQLKDLDQRFGIGQPLATPKDIASQLKGTTEGTDGFRPASDEEGDGAERIKAKAGANVGRLTQLLGPKLYGEPSQMPYVSVKEMMQNSFDAIKPMQEKGQLKKGKINITVEESTRLITVVDNGTGMSPQTLSTTFLTLAGTEKEGERDSGGLGIAKMQFLFNNDSIRVVTMRDGVASELRSNGARLKASMDDPSVSPDIFVYKGDAIPDYVKRMLPEGHGTYAQVMVPEAYNDTATGKEKKINIPTYVSAYKVLKDSPLFSDIDVEFNGTFLPIGSAFPYEDYTTFSNINFDWGVARIYVSNEKIDTYGDNAQVLSNGLWQFGLELKSGNKTIPRKFYIDVSPKKGVKPEDPSYPFDLNRQRFSPSVENSFGKIFKYLRAVYAAGSLASEVNTFGSISYVDKGTSGRKVDVSLPQELAPPLQSSLVKASAISEGDQIEVRDGVLYVKGKAVPELTDEDLKDTAIDVSDFKIDSSLIDNNRVIIHNNAGVSKVDRTEVIELEREHEGLENELYAKYKVFGPSEVKDSDARIKYKEKFREVEKKLKKAKQGDVTSILDVGRDKFGERFDEFLYEIGDSFRELRNFVVTLDKGFSEFTDQAIGVSLDKTYRGVSIAIPFPGVFINPFAPEFKDISGAAAGTWGTMVHELAHIRERGHDSDFAAEMQRINLLLSKSEIEGDSTWPDIKKRILTAFRNYKNVFEYFSKELEDEKLVSIGKRLSDSSEEQVGDARTPKSVAGLRGAAEGEPKLPGRIDLRAASPAEERERARDAGEATTTDLEQRLIELTLKPGDVHPTIVKAISENDLNGALRIASQRLTGFSAELARTLLALKLPTNISFNAGRDLVRQSIDNMSAPEQKRLFRYVQTHYPEIYNKYFTSYDRSESLETVGAGLVELQKPNYKLGPVIAEYDTVAGAYKKYLEGLTVPGAYYPDFDEITLNTDTATGKSYRVMLHEVVHAATEYVLNTYKTAPETLSEGQKEAARELTKMYDYAVTKIDGNEYGLTNIYEFIAEVFTNKRFQETLKNIKYEVKKPAPFLSRLIKAIFKMVGFDNLASNAMMEATNIFSAVRRPEVTARGPRFAQSGPRKARIKGPISTPQTWRTAEQVNKTTLEVLGDALKGRNSWPEVLKIIGPSMWDASTGVYRRTVLGFANLRQIDDLTKTKFPQISGAVRMIERMLAYRGKILKDAEDIINKWTKAQAKKPKQSELMSRVMLEATIRGIDPDRPSTVPANKTLNPALLNAWNALDPEFKEIYRAVRDFYADSVKRMVREMKLRAVKGAKDKAARRAAIREIDEKFGPDKLIAPYFPLRRFGKYWFQVGKGDFKEFYEFEDAISRELAMRNRESELRRGNAQQQGYADTIRKGNGLSELFSQNLSTTKALQEAEKLIKSITATTVDEAKKEMRDSLTQLMYILLPQQSMRKMFINRKAIQGASSDMLRVFASSAVHSAYQQSRFKYAEPFLNNLTTAVEYVEEFTDRDRAAVYRDYIQEVERRSPTILSNEDTSLAAAAAGKASELTFYFMLSAPFSALLNLIGVGQITMPYIGSRYGYVKTNALMIKNMGRYLATMPKRTLLPAARGQVFDMQFPSIVEGGKLSPLLQRAADRFIEEGQIDISLTNDIFNMGDRPSDLYTGRYNGVKKMISGLFHQSERLGREISLLTTFELAYEKLSKSPKKDLRGVIERDAQGNPVMNTANEAFELAVAEAKDIVGLSLGDFTRQMKPRYFTPPLLSVLTKFKQYSVLATYAVVRNFYFTVAAPFRKKEIEDFRKEMVKAKLSPPVIEQRIAEAEAQRKELYREGRRRLAGILAVTYLLGGNEASPFYSIGLGPLIKLLSDEDDDDEFFDWENWLKNYMEEELGGAAGDLFAEMGADPAKAAEWGRSVGSALQRGVVTEMTGGEFANRVSLDPKSLWYREGRYSPDTRESLTQEIIANAGPVVGLGFNWVDAYDLFKEGQYQRAFEKAAPAIISKPVAAARIAEEDARTASGIKLADNFSAWELAMQAIGLQPTRLAQAQKSAIEAKQREQQLKDRRSSIMDRLWLERNNPEGFDETVQRAIEFSLKYPSFGIDSKQIQESFERRGENQAAAEALGAQLDKKSLPETLQMLRYGRE
jgi:hypothetical protein